LVKLFFDRVEERGEHPFLWAKHEGRFRPLSWRETARQVSELAHGLLALGLKHGERVVLVAENRPKWLIADLAIMAAGGVTVPAYTTNTVEDHRHIVNNSGAVGMIISTAKLAKTALPAAHTSEALKFAITMEPMERQQSLNVDILDWQAALNRGQNMSGNVLADAEDLKRTDTACIIYTSGTGGVPKGVVTSHGAILHNLAGATAVLDQLGLHDDVFLSFLPLSHAYEHTAGQFFPIALGAQIYYAEGADKLLANMDEAHPTIIMAVPRLYEMMHARILRGVEKEGGTKEALFKKTLALGKKAFLVPHTMTWVEKMQNAALDKLVRKKVAKRFGGRLKAFVSGGAPLNPDIGLFFTALGVRILQGYGQTETGPVVCVNVPQKLKMHAVGPIFPNTEVKIAEDGEILVRGELVMKAYWNDDAATANTLKDGWLHTGDIGLIDADGHLQITDRKKDIIVNSGGDNIAPQRIEGMLTLEPEIAQAMVYGDKRSHLSALLVPDAEWLAGWTATHGKTGDLAQLSIDDDLHKALMDAVSRVNAHLSNIEKVRKFVVAPEPFTIENAQMTPTLKVRRHKLIEIYGDRLAALYG
jgi:long-chain acyl-CoA synthetase